MARSFFKNLSLEKIGSGFKSLLTSSPTSLNPNINPGPIYIDPTSHTTPGHEDGWFFEYAGAASTYFRYTDYQSCVNAYIQCPPVAAIVNRKAQAFINGKTFILDKNGKEATSADAVRIRDMMRNPNPLQTQNQFEAQLYMFVDLFGFSIILPVKPFGVEDVRSLWNIPPSWIDWDATNERFNINGGVYLKEIVVKFNGVNTILQLADLVIVRGFTPSFDRITFPASKIISMVQVISNVIGALESRGTLINHRGAIGILSQDPGKGAYSPIALTTTQKDELQKDFRRYGLKRGQWQVILTTASLKWQQMGYPTKDLLLMEEVQESTKSICDGFNYPPHLLGLIDPTFNNQTAAEKGLYQNSIIPDADNIYSYWNKFFDTEALGLNIVKDYAHIAALQEDRESLARARNYLSMALDMEWKNGWIKLNRVLELLDEDTIGTEGDIYYNEWLANNQASALVGAPPAIAGGAGGNAPKMLQMMQGRDADGQFSAGVTAFWNSLFPNGQNLNGNGKTQKPTNGATKS